MRTKLGFFVCGAFSLLMFSAVASAHNHMSCTKDGADVKVSGKNEKAKEAACKKAGGAWGEKKKDEAAKDEKKEAGGGGGW